MAELRITVDRKFVKRYAEGYYGDNLVATNGEDLLEAAFNREFVLTHQQITAVEKVISEPSGITLIIAEDGTIRLG